MRRWRVQAKRNMTHKRGTVLLLVVAVLALLAVMGTAYIVMARTERYSARSTTDAVNMDLAMDGVVNVVRQTIFDSTVGPNGIIMEMPPTWRAWKDYKVNNIVMGRDFRVYCCQTDHTSAFTTADGPPPNSNRWIAMQAWTKGVSYQNGVDYVWTSYNGTNGTIYKCIGDHTSAAGDMNSSGQLTNNANWQVVGGATSNLQQLQMARYYDYPDPAAEFPASANIEKDYLRARSDSATPSQGWLVRNVRAIDGNSPNYDWSRLASTRFNPFDPTNPLPAYANAQTNAGETQVVRLDVTVPNDGVWYLLPYSSASGVRYRYSVAIVDTNRFANLNVGLLALNPTGSDSNGQYLTSMILNSAPSAGTAIYNAADNPPENLDTYNNGTLCGKAAITGATSYQNWQDRALALERFGMSADALWFDLSDELGLRTYGNYGNGYKCRPEVLWSQTLKTGAPGSSQRGYHTAYSYDRNLSQPLTPRYTFTAGGNSYTFPANGKLLPLRGASPTAVELVRNAAYLANAMYAAGYSDDESLATALNYIGQMNDSMKNASIVPAAGGGMLVLPGAGNVPITGITVTKAYIPQRAHPYLNEIVIMGTRTTDPGPPPSTVTKVTDVALELVLPYSGTVDVDDLRITIDDEVWVAKLGTEVFSDANAALDKRMPGLSFAAISPPPVVATDAQITMPTSGKANDTIKFAPAGEPNGKMPGLSGTIRLQRRYTDSSGATQWMTVDYLSYAFTAPTTDGTFTYSLQRNDNIVKNVANISVVTATALPSDCNTDPTIASTLNAVNDLTATQATNPTAAGIDLYDRFGITGGMAPASYEIIQSNIGDLLGYLRVCPIYDPAAPSGAKEQTTGSQLANLNTLVSSSLYPQEAKIRFDFLNDPRAQRFLQLVASVDRASDGLAQIDSAQVDSLDEVRIPGRINVNTASGNVLRAIPNMTDKAVANILAYRDRTSNLTFGSATSDDFTNLRAFPGRGIRSLAELLIPVGFAESRLKLSGDKIIAGTGIASLLDIANPSTLWPKLATLCTVRSDTFIVYGYMEAIKQNPNYSGTHDNAANWYGAATAATDPNILVAKKRFIAIIDRSWSNYPRGNANFRLPRVVAIKDLPQ